MKSALRHIRWFYRSRACRYPGYFNWQQRQTVFLRSDFCLLHESDFHAFPKRNLTTGSLFVDAGANYRHSIDIFRPLFPDCAILAFETNPFAFRNYYFAAISLAEAAACKL
jgi:hypothetical protein